MDTSIHSETAQVEWDHLPPFLERCLLSGIDHELDLSGALTVGTAKKN